LASLSGLLHIAVILVSNVKVNYCAAIADRLINRWFTIIYM